MIIIYQRIIPTYRYKVFLKLINEFKSIKIIYGQKNKHELTTIEECILNDNFVKVKNYYLNSNSDVFFSNLVKYLFINRPSVVISVGNLGNISIVPLIILKSILNYKLILWTHGWNRKKKFSPSDNFIDKLRILLYKYSDAIILYNNEGKDELSKYISKSKLFVANNTLDIEKNTKLYQKFIEVGRESVKKSLNVKNKFNLIFLGKLISSKEPFELLLIYELLKKMGLDVGLIYIGSGPEEEKIKQYILDREVVDVKLLGQILDEELIGKYFFSSDLMVIPGFVGLAVIHAFSYGCPILTKKKDEILGPFHSPEIEYVRNDETGFLVSSERDLIVSIIFEYLNSNKKQNQIKKNIEILMKKEASLCSFIGGFKDAINYVNNNE